MALVWYNCIDLYSKIIVVYVAVSMLIICIVPEATIIVHYQT